MTSDDDLPLVAANMWIAVRPYRMSDTYAIGERIEHPTFGLGLVEIVEPGKIMVFFEAGRRTLVHARPR